MSEISLTAEAFVRFLHKNQNTKLYAMPERYCPTDRPCLLVSYELYQKILDEMKEEKQMNEIKRISRRQQRKQKTQELRDKVNEKLRRLVDKLHGPGPCKGE